jgi:hypothetical protein
MAAWSDETWRLVEEVTDGGAFNTKGGNDKVLTVRIARYRTVS